MRILNRFLILSSAAAIVAGCSGDSNNTTISVAPVTTETINISDQAELLEYFDDSTYLSESLGDAGMGENGLVIAPYVIDFSGGTLDWSVSGLVESGSYVFLDEDSMMVTLGNAVFEVPIDTTQNTIVWMGEIYTREQ